MSVEPAGGTSAAPAYGSLRFENSHGSNPGAAGAFNVYGKSRHLESERLRDFIQSDTPRRAGGLMSSAASKAARC